MNNHNIENYDEKQNVCNNQDDYNIALRKAVDYNIALRKDVDYNEYKIYIILWAIVFVWAIIVALKVSDPEHRVIHIVLAAVFSPAYLIAHYIVQLGLQKEKTGLVASFF